MIRDRLKKLLGYRAAAQCWLRPNLRQELVRLAFSTVPDDFAVQHDEERVPHLVLMVGHTAAGKSHLINGCSDLRGMRRVETEALHRALRRAYKRFEVDEVGSPAYWELQALTGLMRRALIGAALRANHDVVSDGCHLDRRERALYIGQARRLDAKASIVFVDCGEGTLRCRLAARTGKGMEALDTVQVRRFRRPTPDEADEVLVFDGAIGNPETFTLNPVTS